MQGWTIWETLANTIDGRRPDPVPRPRRGAPRLQHQERRPDKPTIVRRLVNGTKARPPIPIVWGISATIERFETAMQEAEATRNRRALPPVIVDPVRVQESGLVKDTLVLDIPDEAGNFDSVLVRRAARKLQDSTERWAEYAQRTGARPRRSSRCWCCRRPNTPDPDDVGIALDTIFAEYPELRATSVRHVFGDHSTQKFGAWEVDWIEPQRVQDDAAVRVLIAKDAISTGWDCPRAEVLVSFRPAKDHTHITQLLGRMVRNPLARRIPGDERLNAVDCILPFFDRTTAVQGGQVPHRRARTTMPGGEKKARHRRPGAAAEPSVPDEVWEVWDALPTETLPQRGARPVKRLVALAQALSADAVCARRSGKVERGDAPHPRRATPRATPTSSTRPSSEIWAVHVKEIAGRFGKTEADLRRVRRARRRPRHPRRLRGGQEGVRRGHRAVVREPPRRRTTGATTMDCATRTSRVGACDIKEVRDKVDREALELTERLFAQHRVAIKAAARRTPAGVRGHPGDGD